MSVAQEKPGSTEKLNLVQRLIVTLSQEDGNAGLAQLFYNLFSSGDVDLTRLGLVESNEPKSNLLQHAENTTGKIFDELHHLLLAQAEIIYLVDSVFSVIESTLVTTKHILTNPPDGLFSGVKLAPPEFLLRPHASVNTQKTNGRQNATTYFPQAVKEIEEWSFWLTAQGSLEEKAQVASLIKLIEAMLELMSDHHFSDACSCFQKIFQELALFEFLAKVTPMTLQITTKTMDEAIRFAEHTKRIVPDGRELELLQQLATLVTTKNLVFGDRESLGLPEAGLLPHHVLVVLVKEIANRAPTGNQAGKLI